MLVLARKTAYRSHNGHPISLSCTSAYGDVSPRVVCACHSPCSAVSFTAARTAAAAAAAAAAAPPSAASSRLLHGSFLKQLPVPKSKKTKRINTSSASPPYMARPVQAANAMRPGLQQTGSVHPMKPRRRIGAGSRTTPGEQPHPRRQRWMDQRHHHHHQQSQQQQSLRSQRPPEDLPRPHSTSLIQDNEVP
ncbi:hypothetical protein Vafri_11839, partial [Volvox africanus]